MPPIRTPKTDVRAGPLAPYGLAPNGHPSYGLAPNGHPPYVHPLNIHPPYVHQPYNHPPYGHPPHVHPPYGVAPHVHPPYGVAPYVHPPHVHPPYGVAPYGLVPVPQAEALAPRNTWDAWNASNASATQAQQPPTPWSEAPQPAQTVPANATEVNATEANATEANATEANATEAYATEANATEANATEAKTAPAKQPLLGKGEKTVDFLFNITWETHYAKLLGKNTRKIIFCNDFALTPEHIDTLVSYPEVCRSLWHFEFRFEDVGYNATNSSKAMTDESVAKLARACPNLRTFKLPGSEDLGDETLIALCRHCPHLTHIDMSSASLRGCNHDVFSGRAFDAMTEHPEWAPKLKGLRVPLPSVGSDKPEVTEFMRAMRQMSTARENLIVQFVEIHEEKKHGDWELKVYDKVKFRNGQRMTDPKKQNRRRYRF